MLRLEQSFRSLQFGRTVASGRNLQIGVFSYLRRTQYLRQAAYVKAGAQFLRQLFVRHGRPFVGPACMRKFGLSVILMGRKQPRIHHRGEQT